MEGFQLNENSNVPLWVQLKDRLMYLIMTERYKEGDQLPTVRELSVKLNLAYNTVSKVYRDLERDGVIRTKQGSGTYVTYQKSDSVSLPDIKIQAEIITLVSDARSFGMTDTEILDAVSKQLERMQ